MHGYTAKVTLLSPKVLRVEFSKTGFFYSGPSFFFKERGDHSEPLQQTEEGSQVIYQSKHFKLRMPKQVDPLKPGAYELRWTAGKESGSWQPGQKDCANLGASFSSLDNCYRDNIASGVHEFDPLLGHDHYRCGAGEFHSEVEKALWKKLERFPELEESMEQMTLLTTGQPSVFGEFPEDLKKTQQKVLAYPPGFLSKEGLTIIRDDSPLWDPEEQWFKPRPEDHLDFTFIAGGRDYKGTLREIVNLAGPIPLLPRWALGVWFSCYREMGFEDFKQLQKDFEKHQLPLHVVVVDCDWHQHGWHGYDWNPELFPNPQKFFDWLREKNLHATFNDHPALIPLKDSHFKAYQEQSESQAKPLTKENSPHPLHIGSVPVDLMDKKQAKAMFDTCHRELTRMGCEMWWIDGMTKHWDGKQGTAWLNHLFYEHAKQEGVQHPLAFSRASGLGCHRTTLAFSGDAWVQWEVLGQEIQSTIRGACSLMAYWSHDIGGFYDHGHKENKLPDDLFIRWTQFGALSPIMRYHSDHGVREPWLYEEETLDLCREALNLRMQLIPYFEQLVQEAHNTGVVPWRPMCFEFPDEEEAYNWWHQTMIGENLLFAPVFQATGEVTCWFPPGSWKHYKTKTVIQGPCIKKWVAKPAEIPLFIKEGVELLQN